MRNPYDKNCKLLNRGRHQNIQKLPCSLIDRILRCPCTKSSLQNLCVPNQNPFDILIRSKKKIMFKFIWKIKRSGIAKAILIKQQKQKSGIIIPNLQGILWGRCNQNNLAVVQKQTWLSVEQNRNPRNKSTHLHPTNFDILTKIRQGEISFINKTGSTMQTDEA